MGRDVNPLGIFRSADHRPLAKPQWRPLRQRCLPFPSVGHPKTAPGANRGNSRRHAPIQGRRYAAGLPGLTYYSGDFSLKRRQRAKPGPKLGIFRNSEYGPKTSVKLRSEASCPKSKAAMTTRGVDQPKNSSPVSPVKMWRLCDCRCLEYAAPRADSRPAPRRWPGDRDNILGLTTPLLRKHVNPCGKYPFDLERMRQPEGGPEEGIP
jgi:hypothetical protein